LPAAPARRLGHFQAVLIGTGNQAHVLALHPLEAGNGVGGDRLIAWPMLRLAIG